MIAVSDQGAGFAASAVADPLHEANLLKPSGRGLLLMRTIMDEVCFSGPAGGNTDCGVTISLTKNRTTPRARMQINADGKPADWLEKVSDEQYRQ